jgi:hypothetical protein
MLLSLGIPYVLYASVHFKCLFIQTQSTWALTNTGEGYHFGAPNFRSDKSSSSSSILYFLLIVLPGLQLCHSINYLSYEHFTLELRYKSPKSREWSLPLDFYWSFYSLSIALLTDFPPRYEQGDIKRV